MLLFYQTGGQLWRLRDGSSLLFMSCSDSAAPKCTETMVGQKHLAWTKNKWGTYQWTPQHLRGGLGPQLGLLESCNTYCHVGNSVNESPLHSPWLKKTVCFGCLWGILVLMWEEGCRPEVHLETAQSKLLVFWWKMGLRDGLRTKCLCVAAPTSFISPKNGSCWIESTHANT